MDDPHPGMLTEIKTCVGKKDVCCPVGKSHSPLFTQTHDAIIDDDRIVGLDRDGLPGLD